MTGRHLTTAITMLVLCGVLVLGLVLGVKTLFAPLPNSDATPSASPSSCSTEKLTKGERLRSRQVVVSVFNAGNRGGLADKTLNALARRGFEKGELGNAPAGAKVRFAQVWTTKKHDAAARLVARQLGRQIRVVVTDENLGEGVDVLVGNNFAGLVKADRSIVVRNRQRACLQGS